MAEVNDGARAIVVVHGIWDSAARVAPLTAGLARHGFTDVHAIDLVPPWGQARIEQLAEQLSTYVARVLGEGDVPQLDVVGFSMGALVTRTYLQLFGGTQHVRRFVSISGPHAGTLTAYAAGLAGVKQMRPGSPLLRALGDDVAGLSTEVHCIYTPYDAMVVPARTAVLKGAASVHRVPVPWHRRMLYDRRVHALCARLLRA